MTSSAVVSSLVITACTGDDESSTSWEMAAASSCTGWGGLICAGGIGICTGSVLLGSFCEVEGTGSGIPLFCGGIVGTEGGPGGGTGGGQVEGQGVVLMQGQGVVLMQGQGGGQMQGQGVALMQGQGGDLKP